MILRYILFLLEGLGKYIEDYLAKISDQNSTNACVSSSDFSLFCQRERERERETSIVI